MVWWSHRVDVSWVVELAVGVRWVQRAVLDSDTWMSLVVVFIQNRVAPVVIIRLLGLVVLLDILALLWVCQPLGHILQVLHLGVEHVGHHVVQDHCWHVVDVGVGVPDGDVPRLVRTQVLEEVVAHFHFQVDQAFLCVLDFDAKVLLAWLLGGRD